MMLHRRKRLRYKIKWNKNIFKSPSGRFFCVQKRSHPVSGGTSCEVIKNKPGYEVQSETLRKFLHNKKLRALLISAILLCIRKQVRTFGVKAAGE